MKSEEGKRATMSNVNTKKKEPVYMRKGLTLLSLVFFWCFTLFGLELFLFLFLSTCFF